MNLFAEHAGLLCPRVGLRGGGMQEGKLNSRFAQRLVGIKEASYISVGGRKWKVSCSLPAYAYHFGALETVR